MSTLQTILQDFRNKAVSERDKGTDFEQLCLVYLRNEAYYRDLYKTVVTYGDWASSQGLSQRDTGIDLVAETQLGEFHAIQCKNYAPSERIYKKDIDSFFTASGKANFTHRIIITTTDDWSENALESIDDQLIPVSVINLADLERSQIKWEEFVVGSDKVSLHPKFDLRPHQENAYQAVEYGFKEADRGKMIMACGTGKTFTSLRITEGLTGAGKRVLFLVPSLALLSQTLTEWTQQSKVQLHNYAVCSDSDVGKQRNREDDRIQTTISDLQYPATTDAKRLAEQVEQRHDSTHMTVVYATYHSIAVISSAQKEYGLGEFDLIICDEAHRTTGATFEGEDESAFVRIHDNDFVKGSKRLYMTATPRIYSESARETEGVDVYSMDDEDYYGKEFFVLTFSEAVARNLLVDYKVVVLAIDEAHINRRLQSLLKDGTNQLKVDDAAKIVGCWKALAKHNMGAIGDDEPMQRAVAFCQVIEADYKGKRHKVSSKLISDMFGDVVKAYQEAEKTSRGDDAEYDPSLDMICEARHVDGSMNAGEKEARISWLKGDSDGIVPDNHCRILSNVRCLSEGVDIPALDAVMFLTPRNSQVDVVQSVGRVMRRAPGKKQGYVILPVVIPSGVSPDEALNQNEPYRVVWQVLNALRAHDDRFDAMINKLEYNFSDPRKMEIVAVTDEVRRRSKPAKKSSGKGSHTLAGEVRDVGAGEYSGQTEIAFQIGEIERALVAKIVRRCGNRFHWEDWANDIAKIANTHIDRIKAILENKDNTSERKAFDAFANELRDDLNNAISDDEIIEMLAQHLITKPVFDALFEGYNFTDHNPISKAMQNVVMALEAHHIDKEANTLKSFYESVQMRAEGIESAEGKQRIIVELYDKFFRNAFPRMTERLGIVYTPLEVVDFIIHSVEDVMQQEFNASLADKNVHIIDPFTGTGTFITRLLQSGIIPTDKLPYKFKREMHANEIVLLAYYIAAINIEATYHGILSGNVTGKESEDEITEVAYVPFEGICLTDTFQMYESEDLVDQLLVENSERRKRQKSLDIRVIIGNPPYSAGQTSANDNNANLAYPQLDERIRTTYAERSVATNKNALYDSYIRSIRWASDRLGDQGVIGFVTNGGFIDANTTDGMRKCLVEEFSNLYIFNLRGNSRLGGKVAKKEGGNVFNVRVNITISILVKKSDTTEHGKILFHDIGDYLSRVEKLERIVEFGSIKGIPEWNLIKPDEYGDWLNQRDDSFDEHIVLGDKRNKDELVLFENYSRGVASGRDAWAYNASQTDLTDNMKRLIANYNAELSRFNDVYPAADRKERQAAINEFIDNDPTQISWTVNLKTELVKNKEIFFDDSSVVRSLYRPYTKQWMYYNRTFNERVYQMPRIFPTADAENLVIQATGVGSKTFSVLISSFLPCLDNIEKGQCFPLYLYDEQSDDKSKEQNTLFANENNSALNRCDAITDEGLAHFQEAYPDNLLTKEDVFYYVYGILHSEDYRTRFQHNLSKELPRIPRVKTFSDFKAFSDAGRKLADLHLNYEGVEKYPVKFSGTLKHDGKDFINASSADFYVTKMKHPKKTDEETGKRVDDLSKIIYNGKITLEGIPEEAYEYVVNSKSAIAWVMERQAVTTHKASGITNDANDWAIETMGSPKYPLELLQRVITVSLETMRIVRNLPPLNLL